MDKVMSYETKSVGSTPFFKCEACPYMALAEDDIKFHLFTFHPDLAKSNGLADNIQIPCPGCAEVYDAEETLRNHLRNHHKMGIKDIRKMIKSLVQIALKGVKLKKELKNNDPPPEPQQNADVKIPPVIEIVPDVSQNQNILPSSVKFISLDELQKMSALSFENVAPKDIEQASLNIVYAEVNTVIPPMPNVQPDLISSIQPRPVIINTKEVEIPMNADNCSVQMCIPKQGRPRAPKVPNNIKKATNPSSNIGQQCKIGGCSARLKSQDNLAYHRKCHQNGRFKCLECNTYLQFVEQLHMHLWREHKIDLELPSCSICEYKNYRKSFIEKVHMKTHSDEKLYPCEVCQKTFKNSHQVAKHRQIHKKNKKCETCHLEFSTPGHLKSHVHAVHKKLKPFMCSNCNFTCARKEQLKTHLRLHSGDKPYVCEECPFRCSDHNSLRRHKKKHNSNTPFKCFYCPYTCIQSQVFTSHMISEHPDIPETNIYKCPFCKLRSENKDKYISHLSSKHSDREGIQLLIDTLNAPDLKTTKPSWTIPSESTQDLIVDSNRIDTNISNESQENIACMEAVNEIPIELDDYDSLQENSTQNYPTNYSISSENSSIIENNNDQEKVTDLTKDANNSEYLISESSNDMERQHFPPQISIQSDNYINTNQYLNTSVPLGQNLLQCNNVNSFTLTTNSLNNNILSHFPIRLPSGMPRKTMALTPIDRIANPKVSGPILKPTQILPVPTLTNSPLNMTIDCEGGPRKKPKISVKSNLILKGPDQVDMFHSQQKMAFRRLEDSERFGLGPVTFNNLITTQFMQIPPEPALSDSPNNIGPFDRGTPPGAPSATNIITGSNPMFAYSPPINDINLIDQQKTPTGNPSYIKLEGSIKQNTQSPSLEKMCTASQGISREYKASPPPEDILVNKTMSEIKNEVKSDSFYNIALNNATSNTPVMDPYLIENIIEQYPGHLDLAGVVLPEQMHRNDVIEIDDNSDDNKLLPRFDMYALDSLYLMNNDFHFLDNDMPANCELGAGEISRKVTEVPIVNAKSHDPGPDIAPVEHSDHGHNNRDPMINNTIRLTTNKINVKNIELMKN